ncbi:hypothetical protein BJX68DRAFT_239413 [Aspergillus pseudodeflectus]|uniref:Uncharacterized protein n=1 Tax=Aspergillus pseudodeflectus TaxID=176178 RepID=A0ABR4K8J8_9EURO
MESAVPRYMARIGTRCSPAAREYPASEAFCRNRKRTLSRRASSVPTRHQSNSTGAMNEKGRIIALLSWTIASRKSNSVRPSSNGGRSQSYMRRSLHTLDQKPRSFVAGPVLLSMFTPAETAHAVAEIDMQGQPRNLETVDLEADFRGEAEEAARTRERGTWEDE